MMMFCPKCGKRMIRVMHFDKDGNYQFLKCSNLKCNFTTRKKNLILSLCKFTK